MTTQSTNYDNRTVDLCILGGFVRADDKLTESALSFQLEAGGYVCTGVAKLAQKVMVLLLTYTMFYDYKWGNTLPMYLTRYSLQSAYAQIKETFSAMASKVIQLLEAQETPRTPLDEQIYSVDLLGITMDSSLGKITMSVRVTSEARSNFDFVIPIQKVP